MEKYVEDTIRYYNEQSTAFAERSESADLSRFHKVFERYLDPGSMILDLGCGTGRDSRYFLEGGYRVIPIDGSLKMCGYAECVLGQPVRHLMFDELEYDTVFDGVWASDSLCHVASNDMEGILAKIERALRPGGALYMGLRLGDFEGMRDGRWFCDWTRDSLNSMLMDEGGFTIAEYMETEDVRDDFHDQWINVILKKDDDK